MDVLKTNGGVCIAGLRMGCERARFANAYLVVWELCPERIVRNVVFRSVGTAFLVVQNVKRHCVLSAALLTNAQSFQGHGGSVPHHNVTMSAALRSCVLPDMRVSGTCKYVKRRLGYLVQRPRRTTETLEKAFKKRCIGHEWRRKRMPGCLASSYAPPASWYAHPGPGDRPSGQCGKGGHRSAPLFRISRNARCVMASCHTCQASQAGGRSGR